MKFASLKLMATASLSLVALPASAQVFHYSFDPASYYTYSGSPVNTPVTGSFDFDAASGLLSNVNYTSVSGTFTTGAEYTPGVPTEIYFGQFGSNYDVFQLAGSLASGGTVQIRSGTHPGIFVNAGGSLTAAATAGAVPEPATWGMMILGFGAAGYAMRRRTKVRMKVSFA